MIGRTAKVFDDAIKSLPQSSEITFFDVGASGGLPPRWEPLASRLNYVGFEPDPGSRLQLIRFLDRVAKKVVLPFALSDKTGVVELNICRKGEVSSIYEPNTELISKFRDPARFDIVKKVEVETRRIDELSLPQADFVKIDVQGAELDVLEGATSHLESVFGLEIEVEFHELYKGQPLFGEVVAYLAKYGLEFLDFTSLIKWDRHDHDDFGQCVFGDALFIKMPESVDFGSSGTDVISKYLALLLVYGRFDLIAVALDMIDQKDKSQFFEFERHLKKLRRRHKTSSFMARYVLAILRRISVVKGVNWMT